MDNPNLIFEGLQLMLIGMGMVFVFLSILVLCTSAMQRFISDEMPTLKSGIDTAQPTADEVAAISSAIHSFRHKSHHSKEK